MAEALLQSHLSNTSIQVISAGAAALVGYPADPLAQEVMQEHGHDISQHRAQQATQSLLTATDLILTLDETHSQWVRTRFPQLIGRTYKLGHWQGNADIADPFRKPKTEFEQAFLEISLYSNDWLKRLKA